jgi:hypothetical protein
VLAAVLAVAGCSSAAPPLSDLGNADGPPSKRPSTSTGTTETEPDAGAPAAAATECAAVPPNNKCGLAPQCGCATNETCDVTNETTGATSCLTAGSATLGRPCAQTGDCLAGFTCAYGACRPYCTTPRTKCTVGGTDLCVEILGADDKPITNKAICTIQCDPRVPSAVCGTNACQWFADYYAPNNMVSDCNYGGTKQALDACTQTSECLPGLTCNDHPKYGPECEKWCRIGQAPSDCGNGFKCKDVFGANAPVIGGVKEGLCQD